MIRLWVETGDIVHPSTVTLVQDNGHLGIVTLSGDIPKISYQKLQTSGFS